MLHYSVISGNPWARLTPSPLRVNGSSTHTSADDVYDPLSQACIVGMCSNLYALPTNCLPTLTIFGSLVSYSITYVDPGLFASRTQCVSTYLRASWDAVSMSFQLSDVIYICVTPAMCQYPAKPCRYKGRKQIPLNTTLTWDCNCHSSFSFFSCGVYCVWKTNSLSLLQPAS